MLCVFNVVHCVHIFIRTSTRHSTRHKLRIAIVLMGVSDMDRAGFLIFKSPQGHNSFATSIIT